MREMTPPQRQPTIPTVTMEILIARYPVLLFDAYGVLVYGECAVPGASELISYLNSIDKPYFIVTNDAMRHPETAAQFYQKFGLQIPAERIITPGTVLSSYFAEHHLQGSRCAVIGTPDSCRYAKEAGGQIVPIQEEQDLDVLIMASEAGYPYLETLDKALTMLFNKVERGGSLHLLLLDPDLIYPKGHNCYGFSTGSGSLLLESALRVRYPAAALSFVGLGKPFRFIYEEAFRRSGTRNMVMIGDQLATDILGAYHFGIDSTLIATGVAQWASGFNMEELHPTYLLSALVPFHL